MAGRRGRPRKNTVRIDITLRLDPEVDGEFLEWLLGLPKGERPAALRQLFYLGRDALTAPEDAGDDRELAEAADSVLGAWEF